MLRLLPLLCLACATPLTPGYFPEARSLLDTSSSTGRLLWQTVSGNMAKGVTYTSTTPAYTYTSTVDGTAEFTQSFFTGSNAKYTIWVRGDGIKAGDNIEVGLDDDCEGETNIATSDGADYMRLSKVVAPIFMLNGFYIKGTSYSFNVDGTNSRTKLNTMHVVIKDGNGDRIGCTTNLLA